MSIHPLGPFTLNPAEIQADRNVGFERRIAALERRPMLNMASWQEPELLNGFADVGGDYAPAGYYLDGAGRVYLQGRLNLTSAFSGDVAFILAENYRPVYVHDFTVVSGFSEGGPVWASVTVKPNGEVSLNWGNAEHAPLSAVEFRRI